MSKILAYTGTMFQDLINGCFNIGNPFDVLKIRKNEFVAILSNFSYAFVCRV